MIKISFTHTHYIPQAILENVETSIVALEIYPDLLMKYYGDYALFDTLEECVLWHKDKYSKKTIKFSIENIAILKELKSLRKAKSVGLEVVQLFHTQDNIFYNKKKGLTEKGYRLLHEIKDNDLVLDLSHLNDDDIRYVLANYDGKIINSHCVCSEIIETIHPRTNAISCETIKLLAERGCVFGIPFVNDLVSKISHDTYENDQGIMADIISQIIFFTGCVGEKNVALGPDFMDVDYFTKVFKQDIRIPSSLYEFQGYQILKNKLKEHSFSDSDISLIMSDNVRSLFGII